MQHDGRAAPRRGTDARIDPEHPLQRRTVHRPLLRGHGPCRAGEDETEDKQHANQRACPIWRMKRHPRSRPSLARPTGGRARRKLRRAALREACHARAGRFTSKSGTGSKGCARTSRPPRHGALAYAPRMTHAARANAAVVPVRTASRTASDAGSVGRVRGTPGGALCASVSPGGRSDHARRARSGLDRRAEGAPRRPAKSSRLPQHRTVVGPRGPQPHGRDGSAAGQARRVAGAAGGRLTRSVERQRRAFRGDAEDGGRPHAGDVRQNDRPAFPADRPPQEPRHRP